ncbi:MAG: tripartite tricarboxylate transporter substrate binding protein [Betaproteobacteria bacterium]|nr:tripartite tricarboxylate transporter substrate binding protein [Betaproteobacteria bacterium]
MKWLKWCAIALQLLPMVVSAQAYPSKPVRVVVAFPPGGSIDVTARIVFDGMTAQLKQEFVLDNRGGAAGSIAAAYFARVAPDGYTVMTHSATHIANAFLYQKLPYHTLNDFIGVTTLARQVGVLVVHPSLPVTSMKQFIALARKRPGAINYGSGGSGSFLHVAMALLAHMTETNMVHVPYRGGGAAAIALISGETQAEIATLGSVVSFINAKQMRAIGVTSEQRVKQFPDIPAIGETVPGFEFTAWVGCFVPAGTPRSMVDRLNGELKKVLADPGVAAKLNALTLEPMHLTPEEFARRLKSDYEKYGQLIKQAAAKVN